MKFNNTKVKSIIIERLFEIFNYKIEYPENENVLIITGPNGFGKTQVLNILYNLFNRQFIFFHKLVFNKISIFLSGNYHIEIIKNKVKNKPELIFAFFDGEKKIETFNYTANIDNQLIKHIARYLPVARIGEHKWIDHRTDRVLSIDELINEYANQLPVEISKGLLKIKNKKANEILNSIKVHLIKEQRLFKRVQNIERNYRHDKEQTVMIETIQSYSDELRGLISERIQQSYIISQSLDSSYPNRLISERKKVSKDEYDKRFAELTIKQEKLTKNGLYETQQEVLGYSEDDAKALLVYLNDLEKKLAVFDDLLEKLELFTNILNERRFTFKSINISREKGFYFKTINNKELKLSELSSGEQHEVVLLYELIFKTKPNILVLIDEPEISLHVTWQKEFLNDLLKIVKIQNFQVLIATHSPSIINDRWDLVYNLEKEDL